MWVVYEIVCTILPYVYHPRLDCLHLQVLTLISYNNKLILFELMNTSLTGSSSFFLKYFFRIHFLLYY